MTFRYFAYGSNMWEPRMHQRCPSARLVGTDVLLGWAARYDKPSTDGSAKLNIRPSATSSVSGVVYEIDTTERARLDAAEPAYTAIETAVGLTFAYLGTPTTAAAYDWYVAIVEAGAIAHGLPPPPAPRALSSQGRPPLQA